MSLQYLEDYAPGQKYGGSLRVKIDTERVKSFAAEFDPQPFHLDGEAAKATLFQGLAASGWHTAAVTMRLLVASDFKPAGGISSKPAPMMPPAGLKRGLWGPPALCFIRPDRRP